MRSKSSENAKKVSEPSNPLDEIEVKPETYDARAQQWISIDAELGIESDQDICNNSSIKGHGRYSCSEPFFSFGQGDYESHVVVCCGTVCLLNPQNGRCIRLNCLIDSGANNSSISSRAAAQLNLKGIPETYTMEVSGGRSRTFQTQLCEVKLGHNNASRERQFEPFKVRIIPTLCGTLKAPDWSKLKNKWDKLKGLDFSPPANDGTVDLLVGTDMAQFFRAGAPDLAIPNGPTVRFTQYGPIALGFTGIPAGQSGRNLSAQSFSSITVQQASPQSTLAGCEGPPVDRSEPEVPCNPARRTSKLAPVLPDPCHEELIYLLETIFEPESRKLQEALLSKHPSPRVTPDHLKAEKIFYNNYKTNQGRASLPLLWKDQPPIGNNFEAAKELFLFIEREYQTEEFMMIGQSTIAEEVQREVTERSFIDWI